MLTDRQLRVSEMQTNAVVQIGINVNDVSGLIFLFVVLLYLCLWICFLSYFVVCISEDKRNL